MTAYELSWPFKWQWYRPVLTPFQKWRKRRADRKTFKREPDDLAKLVVEAAELDDNDKSFDAFVHHRFWRPFDHSVRWSFKYGYAFVGLTVATIAAGLISSALATSSWGGRDLTVAALGLIVAVATTVNRLWRPNRRSAMRHRAANELRREGWAFVRRQDEYADEAPEERIKLFSETIEDINGAAESIDEEAIEAGGEG